jgi:hypothetical protein
MAIADVSAAVSGAAVTMPAAAIATTHQIHRRLGRAARLLRGSGAASADPKFCMLAPSGAPVDKF